MSTPTKQIVAEDGKPQKARGRRSRSESARSVAVLVLVVLITVFAVLNLDEVKVHWIVGSGHAPLIIVIVVSLLVGIVATHFAERQARRRR